MHRQDAAGDPLAIPRAAPAGDRGLLAAILVGGMAGTLVRLLLSELLPHAEGSWPWGTLVANVTARPTLDPEAIRRMLVEQVTGRVRWRESMDWMATEGGVTRFAEAGSGKVLSGMAKRIAPDAEATPLNTPADLEAFAGSL